MQERETVESAAKAAWRDLPHVAGPIPATAESKPFLSAREALEAVGYAEDEYFLSGNARVYDWAGAGHAVTIIGGPGRYVTRILVVRPQDPARFGGNVEVTVLNASLGIDFGGPSDFARMVEQGDVWIGITTKSVTANALKRFDPVRYAPLDWTNPVVPQDRCAFPTMIPAYMTGSTLSHEDIAKAGSADSRPETEDGLVWDMLGQLGLLLKSDKRSQILPGFSKPWTFMTGVSQSSIYIRTWAAAFHDLYRTAEGEPVYDGYLAVIGPAMIKINQCAADVPLDDPKQKLFPFDAAFITLSSEGEMWQGGRTRQPDVFTPKGGIVTYEVAGGSHQARDVPGYTPDVIALAGMADMVRAGLTMPDASAMSQVMPANALSNDFIWQPLVRGAFRNLVLWTREHIKPPQAPPIELDAGGEIVRDSYGNARGGLRMPYIEAPLAAHTGYLAAGGYGGVMGMKTPFPPQTLSALYADHSTYLAKFSVATDRLLEGRWIFANDAAAMKAAAAVSILDIPANP
jgi:hypothetical protein